MYLVVVNDERGALVSEQELRDELTIGRTTENAIILSDSAVSRKHAVIYVDRGTVFVEDLNSANGVFLDDVRIQGTTQLFVEQQLRIGSYRIFIEEQVIPQESEQRGFLTAVVHPNQAHGKLVLINGPQAGLEYSLFEPIVSVGRTEEKDITISDNSVSRHHAQIKKEDNGSYIITDPNSSNGTFVRGQRVRNGLRAYHGDRVRFGHIECLLLDPEGKGEAARTPLINYVLIALGITAAALLGWWDLF
jgi:pSer/pThr/pTyr-binding forkhead associated (FHA) protein